ncbi:MAG: FAD-dependent oxidoreductase [Chloroflexota bacterium]
MEALNLTIDGKQVAAKPGMTVLEAALEAGIYIPTLCYHPVLKPYGGCRMCVVEIEKMRGLPTSCTTPAADGMIVKTDTPQLQEFRRGVLGLVLSEHPHACLVCWRNERCKPSDICLRNVNITERCVTCPKNRQCELQRVVDYVGLKETDLPYTYKEVPVHRDPLITRDYNLCILCGRCVRVCQETRGISAITFTNRGSQALVGTAFDVPLKDSGCVFCGSCVEVCPTGALMDRKAIWQPWLDPEEVKVPCHYACPAGINVPLYVFLAGDGKYQDSLAIVREKVPFPGVLGRVCIHPCEQACRRGELNEPIAIKEIKRFVADHDKGEWKKFSKKLPPTGKKVAVIGAGPAGLTAGYYLAKSGHSVTVFEALSQPGGMMRVGIPDYRLPKNILEGEVDVIRQVGVDIKLNSRIDSIDSLFEQGYNAVFVGVGAHRGMKLGIPGEDSPGVIDGATFLRKVSLGETVKLGNRVAVVGGGNVAIDGARVALRSGAKQVKIIYRRTREEMPASPEEIEAAIEEGIEMVYLTAPLSVSKQADHLSLTCQRMQLGEPDASGRRRPVPIKGSEFTMELDAIIGAIGQGPEIPSGFNLKTGRGNIIEANPDTLLTSRKGVWAGGDVVTGPASVIGAIAAGRKAAVSIDKFLGGQGVIDEELTKERQINACFGIRPDFINWHRVKMPCLPVERRANSSIEVETGLTEEQANLEGRRCFTCGFRLQIPPVPLPPIKARNTDLVAWEKVK